MSHIKKFSYPEISKRKLILFLSFLIFFCLTAVTALLITKLQIIFPYENVAKYIISASALSIFIGNFLGKAIYKKFLKSRRITMFFIAIFFFTIVGGFYFLQTVPSQFPFIMLFIDKLIPLGLLLLLPSFTAGVVTPYFLKISTGDFIDDKNLTVSFAFSLFFAISLGAFATVYLLPVVGEQTYIYGIAGVVSLTFITSFFMGNFEYNPKALFAQHFMDEESPEKSPIKTRDDLLFTYINFSFIIIYLFLSYMLFVQKTKNSPENLFLFTGFALGSLALAMALSSLFKLKFWHIFSEILFPLSFIASFFLIEWGVLDLSPLSALFLINIPSLIYGFSLNQTLNNIVQKFGHTKRYNICDFSLFILPIPILIILSFTKFSQSTFFGLLYAIMTVNLLIPGIFIFSLKKSIKTKIIYIIVLILVIPTVIFNHKYLRGKTTEGQFIENITNFQSLRKTNYNKSYITADDIVSYENQPIFQINDSRILNMKRAASVALLYARHGANILAIDSNLPFFKNPVYNLFKNFKCINNIPSKQLDGKKLPVLGNIKYESSNSNILLFLRKNKRLYDIIIDVPNIRDQQVSDYRFLKEYLRGLRKGLKKGGVYIKVFDLNYCPTGRMEKALINQRATFKNNIAFLFANFFVVVSSDNIKSLEIKEQSIKNIKRLLTKKYSERLFFQPMQILNNILFTGIDFALPFFCPNGDKMKAPASHSSILKEYFISYQPEWFNMLIPAKKTNELRQTITKFFTKNKEVLNLFKKLELYEASNDYKNETDSIVKIQKLAKIKTELRAYINRNLSIKEKHYKNKAEVYEKQKDWNNAEELYKVLLAIDGENFEANYRIGILYLTVQNFDMAFKYISKALKLNKNHPDVLYQMGVLMFSDNKPDEAIKYLTKAYEKKTKHASLFMYMGLSYMKKEQFQKAREFFQKARVKKPNDNKIKYLLEEINKQLDKKNSYFNPDKRTSMLDDEKDEKIDLPINKKALRSRLNNEGK